MKIKKRKYRRNIYEQSPGYDRGELDAHGYESSAGEAMRNWPKFEPKSGGGGGTSFFEGDGGGDIVSKHGDFEPGCLYLDININNWEEILSKVDEEDLCDTPKRSFVHNPKLSLFCTNKKVSFRNIKEVLSKLKVTPSFYVKGVKLDERKDHSVLYFDIQSVHLEVLNKALSDLFLDSKSQNRHFRPKIEIACLSPDVQGEVYETDLVPFKVKSSDFIYVDSEGKQNEYEVLSLITEKKTYNQNSNMKRRFNKKQVLNILKEQMYLHDEDRGKDYSFSKNSPYSRDSMPQVSAPYYFVKNNLDEFGVTYQPVKKRVGDLEPFQDELEDDKVTDFSSKYEEGYDIDPIYISQDDKICDGHHRAAGKMKSSGKDGEIKAIKINRPNVEVPHLLGRIQDRWEMIQDEKPDNFFEEFDKIFDEEVDDETRFAYNDIP